MPAAMTEPKMPRRPRSGSAAMPSWAPLTRTSRPSSPASGRRTPEAVRLEHRDDAAAEQVGRDQERHLLPARVERAADDQRHRHRARIHDQHVLEAEREQPVRAAAPRRTGCTALSDPGAVVADVGVAEATATISCAPTIGPRDRARSAPFRVAFNEARVVPTRAVCHRDLLPRPKAGAQVLGRGGSAPIADNPSSHVT